MGPPMLLCPHPGAVQLLGHVNKNAKQREGLSSSSSTIRKMPVSVQSSLKLPAFLNQSVSIYSKTRSHGSGFPWRKGFVIVAASTTQSEVSVEEPATEVVAEEEEEEEAATSETLEVDSEAAPQESKPQGKRNGPRNNRTIVVSQDQLVSGANFPGKVTAIQPFGAFVDIGAFTNGLIHISRLSKGFVKKVEDVVQIGQEVNVQILDVDFDAKRISLMLVEEEKEDSSQAAEGEDGASRSEQGGGRGGRRERRTRQQAATPTKLKKNEIVVGTVKNLISSGVFLSLPDGTDGYLPVREVIFKGANTNLEANFPVGQEVTLRVLRIDRGRATLTTKQEIDYDKINEDLNKDVVGGATNPFEIAFRKNEAIAKYLSEKDKLKAEEEKQEEESVPVSETEEVVAETATEDEPKSADEATSENNVTAEAKEEEPTEEVQEESKPSDESEEQETSKDDASPTEAVSSSSVES